MGITCGATDFSSLSIWIRKTFDSTGDFLVKTWPSAVSVEFVFGAIKWGVTVATEIGSGLPEVIVLTGKRWFGAGIEYDISFLRSESI